MTIIHDVDFTKVNNVEEYINANNHWVYCNLEDGSSIHPNDTHNQEIYKHVYKNSGGYLEFYRFSTTSQTSSGLRPRIELVPVYARIPKRTPVHIRYEVSLVEGGYDFRGMIFQIMDHKNEGGTLPVFQFEMRYGKLHVRWTPVDENSNPGSTVIKSIATPTWGNNQWHNLDVYAYLSHVESEGYFKVYYNGNFVWERNGINASQTYNPQMQYGIYSVPGVKCRTQVRKLLMETVSEIPPGNTLPENPIPPPVQSEYFTILAIGQSNMIAGSSRDDNNTRVRSDYSQNVEWYDYNDTHQFSTAARMNYQTTSGSGSCAKFCANALIPYLNGKKIVILPMAQSGTSTGQWTMGNSARLSENTVACCKESFAKKPGGYMNLVIWLQGETDRNQPDGYDKRLARIMNDLQNAIPQWDNNTIIACAEISEKVSSIANHPDNVDKINANIAKYVSGRPRAGLVESSTYPMNSDNLHFSPSSIKRIGEEFGQRYIEGVGGEVVQPTPEPNPPQLDYNGFYLYDLSTDTVLGRLREGDTIEQYSVLYNYTKPEDVSIVKYYIDNNISNYPKFESPPYIRSDVPLGQHNLKVHVMNKANTSILLQQNVNVNVVEKAEPVPPEPEFDNGFYRFELDSDTPLTNGDTVQNDESIVYRYQYPENVSVVKFFIDNNLVNTFDKEPYMVPGVPVGNHNIKVHVMDKSNTSILLQQNVDVVSVGDVEPPIDPEPPVDIVLDQTITVSGKYRILITKIE